MVKCSALVEVNKKYIKNMIQWEADMILLKHSIYNKTNVILQKFKFILYFFSSRNFS